MRAGIKIGVIFLVCGLIVITVLSGSLGPSSVPSMPVDWKTVDILSRSLPIDVADRRREVRSTSKIIKIHGIDLFYREALLRSNAGHTGQSLLLLHGRSFSSETWENLGTLNTMASLGYRVIAIDLPGYGNTRMQFSGDKAAFLKSVIDDLNLTKPVIVSPSMSGEYSVRFLENYSDSISGYVPVAPVATDSVPQNVLQNVKVPTLIVYGSHDNTGLAEKSLNNLKVLPNSREVKIQNAGHPAYLNQPDLWHKILYNFFLLLQND